MNNTQETKELLQEYTEYLDDLVISGRSTKNKKTALKIFFSFLNDNDLDFITLKIKEAQDFQTHLITQIDSTGKIRYCKGSVTTIMGSITDFYIYLKKKKKVYTNPFLEVKRVKRCKSLPRNILKEEAMSKFLEHFKCFCKGKNLNERKSLYKAHVISELMYSTGMRIGEVMKLKEEDIDFNRGTIKIKDVKNGVVRQGILNEYCQKVLRIYIEIRDYILFGKNRGDMRLLFGTKCNLKIWLNMILNRESKKLKLGKFSSHNFRHAVGFHLLRGGCNIRYIQDILGHKALSSTQIYTKVEKEDLRRVLDKYHPRIFRKPR